MFRFNDNSRVETQTMTIPATADLRMGEPKFRSIAYPSPEKRYGGFTCPSPLEQFAERVKTINE